MEQWLYRHSFGLIISMSHVFQSFLFYLNVFRSVGTIAIAVATDADLHIIGNTNSANKFRGKTAKYLSINKTLKCVAVRIIDVFRHWSTAACYL